MTWRLAPARPIRPGLEHARGAPELDTWAELICPRPANMLKGNRIWALKFPNSADRSYWMQMSRRAPDSPCACKFNDCLFLL